MGVGGQVMKSGETRREKNQNPRRAALPVPRYVVGLWLSHRPVLQGWALPGRVCSWWWTKMLCSKAKMREIRICTKKCGGREDLWKWDDNKFPMVGTIVCNWNVMSFPLWLLMDVYVWRKQDSFLLHLLPLFHHCFGGLSTQHENKWTHSVVIIERMELQELSFNLFMGFPGTLLITGKLP